MAQNKKIKEFPPGALVNWNVTSAKGAITQQTQGVFTQITALTRGMLQDSRYRSVLEKRVLGLIKSPVIVRPASSEAGADPREEMAAKLVQDNLSTLLPETQLIRFMNWYHSISIVDAALDWDTKGEYWVPSLRVLNPEHLQYMQSYDEYWHNTDEGQQVVVPGDGDWVMMSSWDLGTPSGFATSLGRLYVTKTYAIQDTQEWNAVHASPILRAFTPAGADPAVRAKFVNDVAAARHTKVIECEQLADGTGYDVEAVVVSTQGKDAIMSTVTYVDTEMAIAVLGANLSTEVVNVGSKAAATVHLGIQRELIKADATILSTVIREQIIRPFIARNLGRDVEPPWVEWLIAGDDLTDKDVDQEVKAAEQVNDVAPEAAPTADQAQGNTTNE